MAAIAPATFPTVGARAAAPSARPPKYPKAPPSAATATSPSSAATAAVSSMACAAPRSTSCARCPALSRRRSTSSGRPMICGGGCGCGPAFRRTYSAASWETWERKACTAASPAAPAPTRSAAACAVGRAAQTARDGGRALWNRPQGCGLGFSLDCTKLSK